MHDRSISALKTVTAEFMRLYWNAQAIRADPPEWGSYSFVGAVPCGDLKGCYAVERDGEVIYVGSGVRRGGGIYEGHGLGARIVSHLIRWDRSIPAVDIASRTFRARSQWEGMSGLWTIGFEAKHAPLALALEAFLIESLRPVKNVTLKPT